ncbi:tape measure protein [Clostridium sp.]|uniref:tape measure protein n=1 Tax=Clostridium sp. TaxID=1506 RepID=UPI0032170A8E
MADGSIVIDTKLDSAGVEKGVKGLGGKLGGIAKTGLTAFTGLIAATGVALGGLGAIGVKYNSEMEQYMSSFTTMLGSAEKATKHLDDLKQFAAKTPFELGDLAKASTTLQAFGTEVDDITPTLKMLGDISLGNKEKFNGLALVFGQVQSQGKLMGQDLLQMINAGFNPLQVISEKTGKSMSELKDEMSKGLITFDMVEQAMTDATSAGGKFDGAMEKQSQTAKGLFSTLKDNFKALAGEVFVPLSDTLKNNILPTALGYIETLTKEFREKGITGLVGAVGEIVAEMITSAASNLPQIINLAVQVIQSFITGIQSNLPQIVIATIAIITSLVNGFITLLPQILQLGIQLIIELARGIAESIPTMLPTLINVIIGICDMIIANIGTIIGVGIQILLALVQGLMDSLPTLIENIPRIINSFAEAIYSNLPTILKAGIDILLMLIKGLIDSIPTLIANIPQIIMAIVNAITLFNWSQLGKNLITWLGDGISAMRGNIGNIASGIAEWVGNVITSIFKGGLSWGKNLISSIGQGFSSMVSFLGNSASSIASGALNAIGNIFSGGVSIGKNLIEGIWNGISSMGDWIMRLIGGFAGNIVQGIKNFFDINSPSRVMRDEVGKYLVQGIGVGFEDETPSLEKSMEKDLSSIVGKMQATVDYNVASTTAGVVARNGFNTPSVITNHNDNGITQNVTIVNPERTPSENARALKKVGRDLGFGY